jgi:hypothetical protein
MRLPCKTGSVKGLLDNVIMTKGEIMKRTQKIILSLMLVSGFSFLLATPLLAKPVDAQVFYYTPTAMENGNIYYTVRENETCDSISYLTGVNIDTLRNLNNLDLDKCRFLQVGQQLLLGTVPTPQITAGPSATPVTNLPTPEPVKGYGTICVYLYDDINGNAMAESNEITDTGLAGGEVSITNPDGSISKTGATINTGDPICFDQIPEGEYTISIAIPDGYNPTSNQNYTINLKAGDTSTVNFSAQASSTLPITTEKANSSVFLAIVGGLIILAGVGLGLYVRIVRRR